MYNTLLIVYINYIVLQLDLLSSSVQQQQQHQLQNLQKQRLLGKIDQMVFFKKQKKNKRKTYFDLNKITYCDIGF